MRSIPFVLALVVLITAGVVTYTSTLGATQAAARSTNALVAARPQYADALATIANSIATQIAAQGSNPRPLQSIPPWQQGGATATTSILADSTDGPGTTATTSSTGALDSAANERRIEIEIQWQPNTAIQPHAHILLLRAYDVAPFITILSDRDTGGYTVPALVPTDDGGCTPTTTSGCDGDAPTLADPSSLAAARLCAGGAGSGSCTSPTETFSATTITQTQWHRNVP